MVERLVLRIIEQSAHPACNGVDPAQPSLGLGGSVSETCVEEKGRTSAVLDTATGYDSII